MQLPGFYRETRYLTWDERLVLSVRRHPFALLRPALETLGVLLLVALLAPPEGTNRFVQLVGLVAAGFVARFAWKALQWWVDRIVLTDKRVFEASGVIARSIAMMPLRRVTDLKYRRSLTGRIFGYGDFYVETAGQDQALSHIAYCPDPDNFYRTVVWLAFGDPSEWLPGEAATDH